MTDTRVPGQICLVEEQGRSVKSGTAEAADRCLACPDVVSGARATGLGYNARVERGLREAFAPGSFLSARPEGSPP